MKLFTRRAIWATLALMIFSFAAQAYIPSIKDIVSRVFAKRSGSSALEISIRHVVLIPGGRAIEIKEQIVRQGSEFFFDWRLGGTSLSVVAQKKGQKYVVKGGKVIAGRSALFLEYLTTSSAESFLRSLESERFIHRGQLFQFKPDYELEEDPHQWKPNEFYLKHPDVSLKRLGSRVTVAVRGLNEPNAKRTVYFDNEYTGLARLEWADSSGLSAWDFLTHTRFKIPGTFPGKLNFVVNNSVRVQSDVTSIHRISGKALDSFLARQRGGPPSVIPDTMEAALELLLSHR